VIPLPRLSSLATHAHGFGVRRRLRQPLTPLTRPVVSVGNIAFGGRAKTPLVAALARAAAAEGLRPAVLTRGYGRRGSGGRLATGSGADGAPWLARVVVDGVGSSAAGAASVLGDEPAWLAASLDGVPIAVSADRAAGAAAALAHGPVDLFLLDDGFQHPLPRQVDVVVVQPADRRSDSWGREPVAALSRADLVLSLGEGGSLCRLPGALRDLQTGDLVHDRPPVVLLVGVGDPDSVAATAAAAGLTVLRTLALGDHRSPGRIRRRALRLPQGAAWLVTEKDAVGWASAAPPPGRALVLGCDLAGTDAVWSAVRNRLDLE
jgi:tetraacyldisaccharide 4'-kinase